MTMTHDQVTELRDSFRNLSAEELRGQLGDDEEQDAVINALLAEGKAVELKDGPLAAPESNAEGLPSIAEGEEGEGGEEGQEAGEGEGAEVAAAVAAPVAEVATPAAPAAPVIDTPAVEVTPAEIPPLDLSYLAEKFDAKLNELQAEKKANFAKMMSGEMPPEEYSDFEAQYDRNRDALRDQKAAEAQWGASVHAFQTQAAKETGINYFADTEKAEALDGWVKHLANNPKNAHQPGEWFMQEAHKKVLVEFGIAAPTPKPAETGAKNVAAEKIVAAKTGRTPNLSNIPPTLSGLPAAASAASGDGGEFDHISNLSGLALEKAIAAMKPDQRERFEAE